MSEPWFSDPNQFGAWFGSIVGGVGGSLLGVLGAAAGTLAPRGKGRRAILGLMSLAAGLGGVMALVGVYALISGQPYAIWYPFLLCGIIFAGVTGPLVVVVRRAYDLAEQRKLDAEAIRQR
jgi:MFS family permease